MLSEVSKPFFSLCFFFFFVSRVRTVTGQLKFAGISGVYLVQPFCWKQDLALANLVPCQSESSISSEGGTSTSWLSLSVLNCTPEHFSLMLARAPCWLQVSLLKRTWDPGGQQIRQIPVCTAAWKQQL